MLMWHFTSALLRSSGSRACPELASCPWTQAVFWEKCSKHALGTSGSRCTINTTRAVKILNEVHWVPSVRTGYHIDKTLLQCLFPEMLLTVSSPDRTDDS